MRATGDTPLPGGPPGSRASRSDIFSSPSTTSMGAHSNQQQSGQNVPPPKRTQDVDELIHFVRNYQGLQRETTDLRLKRHALLPGIGRTAAGDHGHNPTGSDRLCGQRENNGHIGYRGDGGDDNDSDVEAELLHGEGRRRTPSPPPLWRSDPNPLSSTQSMHGSRYAQPPPASHSQSDFDMRSSSTTNRMSNAHHHRLPGALSGGGGGTGVSGGGGGGGGASRRRITADVHQLPPIQFQEIPERPEAPVPGGSGSNGSDKMQHRHQPQHRDRPKSAGLRKRRNLSIGDDSDSFTERLSMRTEADDVDYIE